MKSSRMTKSRLGLLCLLLLSQMSVAQTEKTPASSGATNIGTHWSLKPVVRPALPKVAHSQWKASNPIDNFVFAKLVSAKLSPSAEASRRVLIRRLYFDLVGLPPTPAEVVTFEKDRDPSAYEKLVERLLASPHYGERWAAHWLDVVRFSESNGFEMNQPRPNAWEYRDYVIEAFNRDKPYNRFILEQFAGDLFGEEAATGFLVAGAWDQVKSPDPVLTASQRADELHDMVSTTGSAFLGLTVGCARCHNHKFDPVPQVDYYAIKACLAGVQHGERPVRTSDDAIRAAKAERQRGELAELERVLEKFEPMAMTGRIVMLDPEPAFNSRVIRLLKPAKVRTFPSGKARGEREDAGDAERLPNNTRGFLAWSNSLNADLLVCEPGLAGRFRIWVSWAANANHTTDARFILAPDGDLETTNRHVAIARVDERRFANGTGEVRDKSLWSGFYDGGAWELTKDSKILLRDGTNDAIATISQIALVEEKIAFEGAEQRGTPRFLRAAVNPQRNVEHFPSVKAQRLRFTISRTTDAEPCIDELEVFSVGPNPGNVALASAGTKASASSVFPNSDIHRIEHINDGKVGNSHSWISNERGKGWVQLEFPKEIAINRVVWARDREEKFSDRLAVDYRIEVAVGSNDWVEVASSRDRVPYVSGRASPSDLTSRGASSDDARELKELLEKRTKLEASIRELTTAPMVYAGKLDAEPEPTHRLQRGDAMQQREVVEPGVLSAVKIAFRVEKHRTDGADPSGLAPRGEPLTSDQQRRLALARWIADPANPLPARVMVNRIWQHHFGEGLVSTPSDFGKKGAAPSHPELLDWLAAEFAAPTVPTTREEKNLVPWSIKHLHRLLVTSTAYRQASASRPEGGAIDAGSRLLWRFPPERLEAEPLRDSILSVSGKLDLKAGGPGFSAFEPNDNYVRVYNPKKEFGPPEWRRMIYMTKVRMQQDSTFGAFDCPDGGQIAPKRMHSTTPLQALNLLNSEFIVQQSGFFAERLKREAGASADAQTKLAYELAYSRSPEPKELSGARAFIAQHGLELFCRAIFNSNEFIFVE
jgi:hypothetical protein